MRITLPPLPWLETWAEEGSDDNVCNADDARDAMRADRAAVLRAVADWMDKSISFRSDELRAAADELAKTDAALTNAAEEQQGILGQDEVRLAKTLDGGNDGR